MTVLSAANGFISFYEAHRDFFPKKADPLAKKPSPCFQEDGWMAAPLFCLLQKTFYLCQNRQRGNRARPRRRKRTCGVGKADHVP